MLSAISPTRGFNMSNDAKDDSFEEMDSEEDEEVTIIDTQLPSNWLTADVSIPFQTAAEAVIAFGTLSVDKEPKRGNVRKEMKLQDNKLLVHFEASEPRLLRVSMNSFIDHLVLVQQTINKFGPPLT
ncbi:EKC/KEOPS complex subunit Lage3 [Octopus sinensis]|uniref:L antigen family member 3 n=1 Tax=Octopus sinensis TaxID=2607531 RepID=A0A6P7S476_9MOLL|nr:EKC/KEOPS complex subunit Lage3 [Octopus sinensis]